MGQRTIQRWICGLMILGLILPQLAGCSKSKNKPAEQKPRILTKENTRVGSDRLALDMGKFPLAQDAKCEIVPVEAPSPLEGVDMQAYSFEIDTNEELLSVVRLTLPYDESGLVGERAEGSICAAYFNENANQWEPVPFTIDDKTKTVTVYTDHLSIYGCFEVRNENTRKAYAAYAIPAFATSKMKELDANTVITNSVQNGGNPDISAVEAGLSVLDLSLAIGGGGVETAAHITSVLGSGGAARSSLLSGVNDRLGDLGLLCSISQVSFGMYNIYNGDKNAIFPCYANALKTGIGYTAGKMGTRLFSLASLGTLVIDLSLNKFAESAWTGRKDIYEKAYSLYYDSPGIKRDARAWAKLFISAKEGATSAEKYKLRVEGIVQRYAEQFWQDDMEIAAYQDEAQKQGFTGGGGLNEAMKMDISNRYRDELFRSSIQEAFKLIAEKEAVAAERALLQELNAIKREFNKTCTIELTDTTVSGDKPTSGLAGSLVYIDVPDTVTDGESWSVTLDSEGKGRITFTVLGFLMAGAPRELKLYEVGSSQSGPPDMVLPFEALYPTTLVELTSSDVEKPELPKISPAESVTTPQQPVAKKYAWVLVETINEDAKANTENINKGGSYQLSATASPGSYTFSSHYIGETDTYPDPDQINGEGYAMKLDFSVPPRTIQGGETVTLSFTLAFTEQNVSYFDGNGSCRADFDRTRFVNGKGKNFFEIYCSQKYSTKNVPSISDAITAKAPNGSSEGDRIELWTGGPSANIGTRYIYEWKMQ